MRKNIFYQLIVFFYIIGVASAYTDDEKNNIEIFKRTSASVVYIKNIKIEYNWSMDPLAVPAGTGSGFIWNKNGYIVTNFHVVVNGDMFLITLKNKKQYRAKLVGREPRKDIAILKIDEKDANLTPIVLGESSNLVVGQKAIAIGNPFGLDYSMTTGIISALGRDIPGFGGVRIRGMIQIDAAINQGNSGGPLFDSQGKLIGMNTMIYSPSGANSGIGFAVPVETIKKVVSQLIQYGKVIQPGLGISVLPDAFLRQLRIPGIAIRTVEPNGSAERAGLQGIQQDEYGRLIIGDIILQIEQYKIRNYDDLYTVLDKFKIGQRVKLTILRKKQIKIIYATLQAM